MFGGSSELASIMEFGFYYCMAFLDIMKSDTYKFHFELKLERLARKPYHLSGLLTFSIHTYIGDWIEIEASNCMVSQFVTVLFKNELIEMESDFNLMLMTVLFTV